jgi:hypothetical protein
MNSANVIEFMSDGCKTKLHKDCLYKWSGLGFQVVCSCPCHIERLDHESLSNKSCDSGDVGLEGQNRQPQSNTTRF